MAEGHSRKKYYHTSKNDTEGMSGIFYRLFKSDQGVLVSTPVHVSGLSQNVPGITLPARESEIRYRLPASTNKASIKEPARVISEGGL